MWKFLFHYFCNRSEIEATHEGIARADQIERLSFAEARNRFLAIASSGHHLVHVEKSTVAIEDALHLHLPPEVHFLLNRFSKVTIGEHYLVARECVHFDEKSSMIIIGGDPQIEDVAVSGVNNDSVFVRCFENTEWKRRHKTVFHLLLVVLDECEEIEDN